MIKLPFVPLPDEAKDAYDLAKELEITVEEAVEIMKDWQFAGYTDCGMEAYVPLSEKEN